jgi:uncharacterized protein (TIGR04255 family)
MLQATAPQVLYRKSPLFEVICQLRFPPLLKISSTQPVGFQEKVRQHYPLFGVTPDNGAYVFRSEDQRWELVLGKGFLALTARSYDGWGTFTARLQVPFQALCDEYHPPFLSRVGLRYRNLIRRSQAGLQGSDWKTLLGPQLASTLSWTDQSAQITGTKNEVMMSLNGSNTRLHLTHGLVTVQGTNERCYLIDCDLSAEEKTEIRDALGRLEYFHREAGRLFRSCITEKLHQALDPVA